MMSFSLQFVLVLIGTFMIALVLTPLVRLFSFKIDAVDYPNARRINTKPMPSAGGLSIVIAFSIATLRVGLYSGSPPAFAATIIALAYFVKSAALLESCAAFLPAIVPCLPMETPPNLKIFVSNYTPIGVLLQ